MQPRPARLLFKNEIVLYAGEDEALPNPLVHINTAKHIDLAPLYDVLPGYAAALHRQEDVVLGQYHASTFVDTRNHFLTITGEHLVREQIPEFRNHQENSADELWQAGSDPKRAMTIDLPALLVPRFGYGVWGHWLNEMLQKIVVAEAIFPGRFSFVMPAEITIPTPKRTYSTSILESLAAYGIGQDRLLRLPPGEIYKFTNLFDIIGCGMAKTHSAVGTLMRSIVADVPSSANNRLLAMRRSTDIRAIYNGQEIAATLQASGFSSLDLRETSFLQQAQAFARSHYVAGELGSNLSGLIFSPPGVRLLSFAPIGRRNTYFIDMIKQRDGAYADIRGPSTYLKENDAHLSPFVVDPADAQTGLAALVSARTQANAIISVCGQTYPRTLGRTALRLNFGLSGNGQRCLRGNWHQPEHGHVWCAEDRATVEITDLPQCVPDYWLELRGISVSNRNFMPARSLMLSINNAPLLETRVTGQIRIFAKIPAGLLANAASLTITIDYPTIAPAFLLGATGDSRRLGIGLTDLFLHEEAGHNANP